MPLVRIWFEAWVYWGLVCGWVEGARPRFDTSTDMGLVLVPADAEVDSVIFRLRATDQDADFPLVFEVAATITPVVRIDNLPCTLYNKVCQANVILTKRLMPGRLHDFAVRVRDTKGDSNSMQATISATNATTSRDKIFPHIPSLIMVPEDTKPGKELDYLLVRANSWSGKPVYIELWQPKELFTIRQRQTPTQTRGVITLIGELDFETQSMYTLTIYATDPYTEPGKDTRNIAGLNIVVVVQDVQDVPPIFTLAPPLTRLNNSVQTGDVILRVHAEDGDKGVPREITYGLVSEGNPFIPFFNISETTGEIVLARPLEELTQITHVGAPVVLSVVAEEIRRSRDEPPAQATVVEVGFLLGEPGNSPPYFENDKYIASIPENLEPGAAITFPEQYSTRVRDEDIGKAGVFALKLQNNNGTFEINPAVAERTADFIVTVRDNTLIDYETHKSLSFKIIAQEVGPATNLSASAAVLIFIQDVNDNSPVFDEESYDVTLSENITAGARVIQVHATDKDTGLFGSIKYTGITGRGSDAFAIDPDTGLITVAMGSSLDREMAEQLQLTVNARDENGKGNMGTVPLIVNLLDVNDNAPIFEKDVYEFMLNSDLTNFTTPAFIKATDADAEPPNNEIRYELIHGNYENKFYLNEITGELILRSPITKFRRKKQSVYDNPSRKLHKGLSQPEHKIREVVTKTTMLLNTTNAMNNVSSETELKRQVGEIKKHRRKRESDIFYTLTARAYDLGVPHLASEARISIIRGTAMEARIMMFVVPGEHPNLTRTVDTLATITGGRVTVLDTRPYVPDNRPGVTGNNVPAEGKRTIVVARVEQTEPGAPLVDVEKIRNALAANGVGIIGGAGTANVSMTYGYGTTTKPPIDRTIPVGGDNTGNYVNKTINSVHEEVTVYKAENKLLFWLLIILGLLMLLAIAALIICCICPGCPFYMAPRKRRVYSSETLIARSNGRPKRHIHRKPMTTIEITSNGKKQAWSADPTRRNWQFNRRNTKNGGLASLPGDVVYISERPPIDQANVESLRLRDGPTYDSSRRRRIEDQERMYMEDVEERKVREYDAADADSLQRHEIERGSDILRQAYRQRYVDPESNNEPAVREQHFYREGNAEVLQLVTRGQVEDDVLSQHRHYPTTLIVDGKDVLLQRFIQDQKARHEVSMQEPEVVRTVESHQRPKNLYQHQQEMLLLPEELEIRSHRHGEEMGPMQKMAMEEVQKMDVESHIRDMHRQDVSMNVAGMSTADRPAILKEQSTTVQTYAFHDLELARQNALLTRLLLEREARHGGGAMTMDAASYLETQSLPGQVAIATQTDRVAATQTERLIRSRSDNDESDEENRSRKKIKTKKRYGESDAKRTRTLWMKSPIKEEESECFDKRLNILRKKVKEVKEGRKVSLEPEVLREISDSLDENGSSYAERKRSSPKDREGTTEESSFAYKVLDEKNGSSSEVSKQRYETFSDEKQAEISSSPEVSIDNGKYVRETTEKRSSRKESRVKKQKKVESVIKPSFRVLEREITMLTKKLSKLADKKTHSSRRQEDKRVIGDDSTNQEKSKTSKDPKRDPEQSITKTKTDERKHRPEASPSTSKGTAAASTKARQKFKYQQPQIMSPGSSDHDDVFEKPAKSKASSRQEAAKHKLTSSRTKVKSKAQTQIERKEHRKQIAQRDRDVDKRKDTVSKESGASDSSKPEKATVKSLSRTQKLAAIGRRENVLEEPSTSTSSDRAESKKDSFAAQDSYKKSTESSDIPSISHQVDVQREPKRELHRTREKFTDDFVVEQHTGIVGQDLLRSKMDTSTYQENLADDEKQTEVTQQFSDDFTLDARARDVEYRMLTDSESRDGPGDAVPHDLVDERVILQEAAERVEALRDLERQVELPETSRVGQIMNGREETVLLDSNVREESEKHRVKRLTLHCSKCAGRAKLADEAGKHEEEMHEALHGGGKEVEREEFTPEKDVHELKVLKDAGESGKEEEDTKEKQQIESPRTLSDLTKHVEQPEEKEIEKNGLYDSTDISPSQIKEESDIKDITSTLYSKEEDKVVESHVDEEDSREKSRHESKEHSEEETPSAEKTMDILRKVSEELITRETEDTPLPKMKNETEEERKVVATDTDGHRDAAEKTEEVTMKRVTSESDSAKEDEQLTIEIFERVSDINQPPESEATYSIDIHPEPLIKESDRTLMDIHETNKEVHRDDLIESKSDKTTDIAEGDGDMDEVKHDLTAEREIESHEAEEESHVSSQEPSKLRETKLNEIGKTELSTLLTEVTTTRQEVTDTEQPQAERAQDAKEESFREEHGEEKEESLEIKEGSKERTEEVLGKVSPSDELKEHPTDANLEKTTVGQPETVDQPETIEAENVDAAGPQNHNQGEQRVDVSETIFSSFIDTLEVSEESDSSSDVSRKTTLTTRPYDTPRHRQKWQQQESLEIAVMSEIRTVDDERVATAAEIEAEEDTDSNISLDEIESTEDSTTMEAPTDRKTEDAGVTERFLLAEKIFSGEEKILSISAERANIEDERDKSIESKVEEVAQLETGIKTDIKEVLKTIRDEVSLIVDVTELKDISRGKVEDTSIPVRKEDAECTSKSATPKKIEEEVSETARRDDKSEIRSLSKQTERVDSKADGASVEDAKTRVKDEVDKTRSEDFKRDAPSISERHAAKKGTAESPVKRRTKAERSKAASPMARKRVLDAEESGGRARSIQPLRRSRRDLDGDPEKQRKKDVGSQKQSRKEEEPQRKQTLPRTKLKVEKKAALIPKTGEIDTSKTQSKYMAWYNKKREEAERKKLEKKVAEDEELPRWVSRSLRYQTAKPRGRLGKEYRTPEITPRTRRKIKPLVNVESEQLKAIVRQGRELRRAEGSFKEDPPIQIFARTPPVSTSDAQQHRLLQHSEYKYEKIPPPFYLHPPPAPHPSPQMSPERSLEVQPSTSQYMQPQDELRAGEIVSLQTGGRLRHQQLLEKKSVFDIAYSEAAPSQLRSDSATPPS